VPIGERTGVLVLRLWLEPAARDGEALRARITAESDLGSGERVTLAAAGLEEILEIVRDWVERFAGGV
jgi:hypothetical protein